MTPTLTPSILPSSTIPTGIPSITGSVVFVDMTKEVTESLNSGDIADIVTQAENSFGVQPGNVQADVTYDITGTVEIDFDDSEYSQEELTNAVQSSIANALGVHTSDIEVSIDSKTGEVTYTISSPTVEDAEVLQEALQTLSTNQEISGAISDAIPAVTKVLIVYNLNFINQQKPRCSWESEFIVSVMLYNSM